MKPVGDATAARFSCPVELGLISTQDSLLAMDNGYWVYSTGVILSLPEDIALEFRSDDRTVNLNIR
jgi:hypothetical protein